MNQKDKIGLYHSASDVIRDGLRLMKERDALHQDRLAQLCGDIAVGVDQAESGQMQQFNEEVTARIKARGRKLRETEKKLDLVRCEGHLRTFLIHRSSCEG